MKINTLVASLATIAVFCSCGSNKEKKESAVYTDSVVYDMAPAACEMAPPGPSQPLAEEYTAIKEQGYKSAVHNPYSTFAIDVDAASYSNMRRMIKEGFLPPVQEVRVEEWINYFHYNYPSPKGANPFSIYTEYSECPWNKNHGLMLVGLKGKEIEIKDSKPNNLVFLIDVSGSMNDADKLPLLKRAFTLMLPKLKSKDRVSVVVYAGAAGVIMEGVRGNKTEEISLALEKLEAGGSTAGGEGIELAYKLAADNFIENGNNRVILATDGDFNVGISTPAELEKFIESKRDKGIYLSVLGFGQGNIKDNIMETLADKGNGNYYYIDDILEARKVLVEQFGGTLNTIAKDVKIQVEFNPYYVKEYRLIGYENRELATEDFNDDKKDAGELGSGHMVTALYEIVPSGSKESNLKVDSLKYTKPASGQNNTELANIKFRYKNPGKNDTVSKLISKPVYAVKKGLTQASPDLKLASAVSEFALLLRDSKYKGDAKLDDAIALVQEARVYDEQGYVAELVQLIKAAKELKATEQSKEE